MEMPLNEKIKKWIWNITQEGDLPKTCQAIYVGMFDGADETYQLHFLGSAIFDENNEDWACEKKGNYLPKNRYLNSGISTQVYFADFLSDVIKIFRELKNDESIILSEVKHLAIGFDSGELHYV